MAGNQLAKVITALQTSEFNFNPNWQATLQQVRHWRDQVSTHFVLDQSERISLDGLMATLLRDQHTMPSSKIRLALVLAGGGAKCAYQAGAIKAIEERLAETNQHFPNSKLDINLVIGTSGGAINAIATAMGITSSAQGADLFVNAWRDLDQREILHTSLTLRLYLGLWLFSLEILIVALILGVRRPDWFERRGLPHYAPLVFAIIHLLFSIPFKPWALLGISPLLHKIWLWFGYGTLFAGLFHLALFIVSFTRYKLETWSFSRRNWCIVFLFLVISLPALQTWNVLFLQETLIESRGIESAIARNYGTLSNFSLKQNGLKELHDFSKLSIHKQLEVLGENLVTNKLLKRDLVLTTAPLTDATRKLPGEFYWYLPASTSSPKPSYGNRGIALSSYPKLVFEILIGSAAIYPVFPAKHIEGFPTADQSLDLIDGSFAHRSPIEAAIQWGATHIILVEAATEEAVPRGNLISNVGAALSYLYDEAQLTDVRSRGRVKLYSLVPKPPQIGLLDFADNMIEQAIDKGYHEALGENGSQIRSGPAFKQEYGEPIFW